MKKCTQIRIDKSQMSFDLEGIRPLTYVYVKCITIGQGSEKYGSFKNSRIYRVKKIKNLTLKYLVLNLNRVFVAFASARVQISGYSRNYTNFKTLWLITGYSSN